MRSQRHFVRCVRFVQCGLAVAMLAACLLVSVSPAADVVTYPAPAGETLSKDYEVTAEGKKVDVYTARVLDPPFAGKEYDYGGPYSFANFDMSGRVTVRITSPRPLGNVVVRPASPDCTVKKEGDHTLVLLLERPLQAEHRARRQEGAAAAVRQSAGERPAEAGRPGRDLLRPGHPQAGPDHRRRQPDAVPGRRRGRQRGGRRAGQRTSASAAAASSTAPTTSGARARTTARWASRAATSRSAASRSAARRTGPSCPRNSRNVTIRNVKLCNSRVQNDDGINPCNSQDVLITDCFIRSDDDCVALKGLDLKGENNNVERIAVENSILWCDRARIFLLGHESRAAVHAERHPAQPRHPPLLDDAVPARAGRGHAPGRHPHRGRARPRRRPGRTDPPEAGRQPVHAEEGARLRSAT